MHDTVVCQKITERLLFPSSVFRVIGDTDQDGEGGGAQPLASLRLPAPECLGMLQSEIAEQRRLPTPRISQNDQMIVATHRLDQFQALI